MFHGFNARFSIASSEYNLETKEHVRKSLKFFLDDGFAILNEELISADDLLFQLNNMDPHIKFTMETDKHQIPFLDVLVVKHGNKIETDIFYKETDTANYYPFDSCGPRHITRNIPVNLAKRICAIVSMDERRNTQLNALKAKLLQKKYPIQLIENSIKIAKQANRQELIRVSRNKNAEKSNIITLVNEYNPNIKDKFPSIRNIFNSLHMTEKVQILSNKTKTSTTNIIPRVLNARMQPKNLQQIFNTKNYNVTRKYTKCNNKKCICCTQIILSESYITQNGTTLKRNYNLNCKSKDLIYCLICPNCNKEYIGETGDHMNMRMNTHRNQIKLEAYRKLPCSKHFYSCGKSNFKIFPFFKCRSNDATYRRAVETHFRKLTDAKLH